MDTTRDAMAVDVVRVEAHPVIDFTRINELHHEVETSLHAGLEKAIQCGNLLAEAKAKCSHGRWEHHLCSAFKGTKRTAQRYMRLAKHYGRLRSEEATRLSHLTMTQALKSIASVTDKAVRVPDRHRMKMLGEALKKPEDFGRAVNTAMRLANLSDRPTQNPANAVRPAPTPPKPKDPAMVAADRIAADFGDDPAYVRLLARELHLLCDKAADRGPTRGNQTDKQWAEALKELDKLADELKAIVASRPPKYNQGKIQWCIDRIVAVAFPDSVVATYRELGIGEARLSTQPKQPVA